MQISHIKVKRVKMYTSVLLPMTQSLPRITVSELQLYSHANECSIKAEILF